MPVIARETMGFNSPKGIVRFIRVTKYDTRRRKFTIDLPGWVKNGFNITCATADTQQGVEREFDRICKEYENSIKHTRKVIAYIVVMGGTAMEGEGDEAHCVKKWTDFSFLGQETMAFGIGYVVLDEVEIGGKSTYQDKYGHRRLNIDDYKIIPWSQQAEDFFARTQGDLQGLMLKVDEFFSDETKVLKRIQSAQSLLLTKELG